MNIINIACWSIGQHAIKNMLPAIDECKEVNLFGIYTRNHERAEEQSKLYNCFQFSDELELLNSSEVDAVYLSSPTGVHAEQISKCLNYGKSVLVEKTALSTLEEAQELICIADKNGLVIMEAFMYRFHKQFRALEELINSKKYGDVIKIDCEFGFPHLKKNDIRYNKSLCGGALYDAGAYTLSAARYLLGDKSTVIWAKTIKTDEFDIDTRGYATITNGDAIANCSWVFGGSYSNIIRLWCESGVIICDRAFSKSPEYLSDIVISQNGSIVETIETGCDNHFVNMLSHFRMQQTLGNNKKETLELLHQAKIINDVLVFGEETVV